MIKIFFNAKRALNSCINRWAFPGLLFIVLHPATAQINTFSMKYSNMSFDVRASSFVESSNVRYLVAGYQSLLCEIDSTGNLLWSKQIGNKHGHYKKIIKTTDANYVLVGDWYNAAESKDNIICVKVNAKGDTLWTREISQSGASQAWSAEPTNDGGFVIIGSASDQTQPEPKVLVIKMNANGNLQWSKTVVSSSHMNYGFCIKQTPDKGYVLALTISDTSQPGKTYAALAKLDETGTVQWTNEYDVTGENFCYGWDVMVTKTGIILTLAVTVYEQLTIMKTDFSGKLLWKKGFGLRVINASTANVPKIPIRATSDGGLMLIGLDQRNYKQTFLKVDSSGTLQWSKAFHMPVVDIMENSESAYLILGNGYPYSMLPAITGLISTDASGNGSECLTTNTPLALNFDFTISHFLSTQTSTGKSRSWNPVISTIYIKSSSGCFPGPMDIAESNDALQHTISVHPNPAVSSIALEGVQDGDIIELYDALGKKIYTELCTASTTTIDISAYSKGLYFYAVASRNRFVSRGKVVFQ